jgi:phage gp46-like protein
MTDTTTIWNRDLSRGDWALAGADLQTGSDFESAILISLFTDREANPDDEIPDGTGDPRGWVGDQGQDYKIGSRLWLLARAKQTTETLQRASDYIAEALQWLLDDGVVARFDITVEWTRPAMLGARILAYQPNGNATPMNFSWVWKAIN